MEVCSVSNEVYQLECTRATRRKKTRDSGSIPSGMGCRDHMPSGDDASPA